MIMTVKVLIFGIRFIEIVYGWLFKFYNEFCIQIGRSDIRSLLNFVIFCCFQNEVKFATALYIALAPAQVGECNVFAHYCACSVLASCCCCVWLASLAHCWRVH